MPTNARTIYYQHLYYRTKDIRKLEYYEKKAKVEEHNELYKPYGGEKQYYTNTIKKWCKDGKL